MYARRASRVKFLTRYYKNFKQSPRLFQYLTSPVSALGIAETSLRFKKRGQHQKWCWPLTFFAGFSFLFCSRTVIYRRRRTKWRLYRLRLSLLVWDTDAVSHSDQESNYPRGVQKFPHDALAAMWYCCFWAWSHFRRQSSRSDYQRPRLLHRHAYVHDIKRRMCDALRTICSVLNQAAASLRPFHIASLLTF